MSPCQPPSYSWPAHNVSIGWADGHVSGPLETKPRATLRGLQRAIEERRATLQRGLDALPDPTSDYAEVHREAIAVHDGMIVALDAKIAAAE